MLGRKDAPGASILASRVQTLLLGELAREVLDCGVGLLLPKQHKMSKLHS